MADDQDSYRQGYDRGFYLGRRYERERSRGSSEPPAIEHQLQQVLTLWRRRAMNLDVQKQSDRAEELRRCHEAIEALVKPTREGDAAPTVPPPPRLPQK